MAKKKMKGEVERISAGRRTDEGDKGYQINKSFCPQEYRSILQTRKQKKDVINQTGGRGLGVSRGRGNGSIIKVSLNLISRKGGGGLYLKATEHNLESGGRAGVNVGFGRATLSPEFWLSILIMVRSMVKGHIKCSEEEGYPVLSQQGDIKVVKKRTGKGHWTIETRGPFAH